MEAVPHKYAVSSLRMIRLLLMIAFIVSRTMLKSVFQADIIRGCAAAVNRKIDQNKPGMAVMVRRYMKSPAVQLPE